MKIKILLLILSLTTLNANNMKHSQVSTKAFNWHHKLALKGSVASQYELALMFHYGSVGLRQNSELAKLWFTRAAKKGHPQAQSILYRFYAGAKPQYFGVEKRTYSMNVRR